MILQKLYGNYKIEITGVIAWTVFTFGALNLIPIYITSEFIHIKVFLICSVIFLLYLFSYYRSAFSFKKFLVIMLIYNVGFCLLNLPYNHLVYFPAAEFDLSGAVITGLINLTICFVVYSVIKKIIAVRTKK